MKKLLPTVLAAFFGTSAVLLIMIMLGGPNHQPNSVQLLTIAPFVGIGMLSVVRRLTGGDE